MASLNSVHLLGNLTRDIELRFTPTGKAVGNFGLAINESFTVNGERKEKTIFCDVTVWGKTAENSAQYLHKGSPALIIGRLSLEEWNDKSTGAKRSKLTVTADNIQFLGSKGDKPAPTQRATQPAASGPDDPMPEGADPSVPF